MIHHNILLVAFLVLLISWYMLNVYFVSNFVFSRKRILFPKFCDRKSTNRLSRCGSATCTITVMKLVVEKKQILKIPQLNCLIRLDWEWRTYKSQRLTLDGGDLLVALRESQFLFGIVCFNSFKLSFKKLVIHVCKSMKRVIFVRKTEK